MKNNELNCFITPNNLAAIVNSIQNNKIYVKLLYKWLDYPCDEEICIVKIATSLVENYERQYNQVYSYSESSVHGIYMLLDIEQKGYINENDIESFLNQIR
jgi:hypothetical protein